MSLKNAIVVTRGTRTELPRLVLINVFINLQHIVSSPIVTKGKSLLCQCYLPEFYFTNKPQMLPLSVLKAYSNSANHVAVKFTIHFLTIISLQRNHLGVLAILTALVTITCRSNSARFNTI